MSKLDYSKELTKHIDFEMTESDKKHAKIEQLIGNINDFYGKPFPTCELDTIIEDLETALSTLYTNSTN